MLTKTEENYLKTIYSLELLHSKNVNTTLIAKELKTRASSVTDMLKKLADKDLVNYKKYQGVKLTLNGKNIAVKIIRRHRLWEVFLVNKLHYNWDQVHELAEQLEHIKSDTLTDKLEAFLNYPEFDPHGDPIPNKDGDITHHKNNMLSSVAINNNYVIIGVKDSSSAFLKLLDSVNLKIGSTVKIISKEEFDSSMVIESNQNSFSISHQTSKNLYVKKI
ncbi:metal-dependent transcriptional regulator [Lutibacter sp. B1]|uniref:metal-dependent transcriptional regulator n=1 Tax=Lutibacter sp. B1 TaxID=2725996 RepID=UPI001456804E|nr:metal-dependent transcriptional regulator [Lutibacter sp. B1]NLP57785.1 metal-dependent transcriptional regulator [Lutibacter sp. B1]